MGVLMAGASPLFAAALAWLLWRERPDRSRRAGFVLMLLGVALLGSKSSTAAEAQAWIGDALFLLAAGMWAGFTLSFRRAGLTPCQGAALVNVWSALLLLPWLVWRGALGLIDAPAHDILLQALWQGVLAGLLGLWMYSAAIARLGAANAAAFAALAPAVSALGGWLVLGDPLGVLEISAVLAAAAGVALASGALSFAISRPRSRFPATARCGDARTAPAPPRPE
jgi:drug/metabolite transporter (DMT)-like permease